MTETNENQDVLEQIILGETEGKNRTIRVFDGIMGKIHRIELQGMDREYGEYFRFEP